jgi:8-oxo-dGTP diphosphatase
MDTDGHVLLAQRPAHKHLGLKWEFPGGKVEANESPESALIREIREELACEIQIDRALPPYRHDYPTVVIEMFPFICTLATGSTPPHPHEHVALAWVATKEVASYDLAPADRPLIGHLG